MHRLRTFVSLAAVAAPLALGASPAQAADTYGSDMNPTHGEGSLSCASYPCTLAQDTFTDGYDAETARTGVITKWRVKLDAGTHAQMRLLESDFGGNYRPVADGPSVTGDGGVIAADTRIPLEGGRYHVGIQLDDGKLEVDTPGEDGTRLLEFDNPWATGDWRSADRNGPFEALSQVVVEPDLDSDGYGDETQDSCVFCSGGGSGSGSGSGGYNGSGGHPGGGYSGSGSTGGGGNPALPAKGPAYKVVIDPRGLFELRDGKPRINVYMDNQGNRDLTGSVSLKWGKKTLKQSVSGKNGQFDLDSGEKDDTSNFVIPKALVKKLKKKGSVFLTATARFPGAGSTTQKIKVRYQGLTNKYDGTYKGTNGIELLVSGGFLININQTLNTYCVGSHKFQFETLFALSGYPLMISRDGSFAAKGSNGPDSIKYSGKIKPHGAFKGYSSIFHNQIRPDTDRIQFESCFAASNWTAKRVK